MTSFIGHLKNLLHKDLAVDVVSIDGYAKALGNRVGGGLKAADLSHHRAYRSVHGGSINLTSDTPFGVVVNH